LSQNRKPLTIQSDKGIEFLNATVQQYLKRQGVAIHTTHNPDIRGAVIERFNFTLKANIPTLVCPEQSEGFNYLPCIAKGK